ncbi:MAG: hypothetical protein WC894_00245 [Patescibacteria group bacterium]
MDKSFEAQLIRIDELIRELETEYDKCLDKKTVSEKAKVITHEVIEKISNVLDQTARSIWEKYMAVNLSDIDKKKSKIYFPKSKDKHSFDSTIGKWMINNLETSYPEIYSFLLSKQPFTNGDNKWLEIINILASQKHIGLTPQKREEITHIKISSQAGTVHLISEQVRFGPGVSILGAPVDPNTQRIIPTPGVEEKIEKWISFVLEGYGLDALEFCRNSYNNVKKVISEAESFK